MSGKLAQLLASGARTASGTAPITGDFSDEDELRLHLRISAVAGTTPTMTLSLQDSLDGGTNWVSVASFAAATAVGTTALNIPITQPFGPLLRLSWTMGGTTPSFTFEVRAFSK